MPDTLLLDRSSWDLCVDASGNIALAAEPYAQSQDVSSACQLVLGELYYDVTKGVPYFSQILGKRPPLALLKAKLVQAALTVSGVIGARVYLTSIGRAIRGQVQFQTATGSGVAAL